MPDQAACQGISVIVVPEPIPQHVQKLLVLRRTSIPIAPPRYFVAQQAFGIALFGVVYAWLARQAVIDRGLVAVGGLGKLGFFFHDARVLAGGRSSRFDGRERNTGLATWCRFCHVGSYRTRCASHGLTGANRREPGSGLKGEREVVPDYRLQPTPAG